MKRSEQKLENTWNLELMYDPTNLNEDLDECFKLVNEVKEYQHIKLDKINIIKALSVYFELLVKIENIYVYFSHLQDVDFTNSQNIAVFNKVKGDYNKMMIETSFLIPNIAKVDDDILQSILNDESLQVYHKTILNIINNKKHYLSDDQEKIISTYGMLGSAAYNVFSSFTNSDLKFPQVNGENNEKLELSESLYSNYIRSQNREIRKDAFTKLFSTYQQYNQTLSTNYLNQLKHSYINMLNRGFHSTLESALNPNQIPTSVYYNLLDSVEKNIHINHKYVSLRKKELQYEELHLYDMYVSMVKDFDQKISYEQAQEMVLDAFKVFSDEYQKIVKQALNNRWIDVYENEGKRSGAYSGGSYTSIPYILLNYTNELNDVFTLAHELGHSMHSYFANENNPYQNANYKIFIAEVASTVNELILINNLLAKNDDIKMKKYLYNYLMEQFRTTMVRQTMFANFELKTHQMVENNEAISNEVLNNLYYSLNQLYFGDDVIIDEEIAYEWSRIPHFFYNYYVYQYATSFSVSLNIVKRILAQEEGILDKYLQFLKLGDSVYPIEALKTLDIDLSTPLIFEQAMQEYERIIDSFENL